MYSQELTIPIPKMGNNIFKFTNWANCNNSQEFCQTNNQIFMNSQELTIPIPKKEIYIYIYIFDFTSWANWNNSQEFRQTNNQNFHKFSGINNSHS